MFTALLILFSVLPVPAQDIRLPVVREQSQRTNRSPGIPEATFTSSPEEEKWWNELRQAGDDVRKSRGREKARKRFEELLKYGRMKNFSAPIEDRGPLFLSRGLPEYTEEARRARINGTVALQVEFLADGTIGNVTPLNRLGGGLEENAQSAAKTFVFLPAVKNRKFVDFSTRVVMGFNVY